MCHQPKKNATDKIEDTLIVHCYIIVLGFFSHFISFHASDLERNITNRNAHIKIYLQAASSISRDSNGIETEKVYFDLFMNLMLYQVCSTDASIRIIIL